jgi:hypothetical protein
MTTPFSSTAMPSASNVAVRSTTAKSNTAPSLADAMSALHPMETHAEPWQKRERWLLALLGSFLPITVGLVVDGTIRTVLLGVGAALIAVGMVSLIVRELRR